MALPKKRISTNKTMPNMNLPPEDDTFTPLSTEEVAELDLIEEKEFNPSMPTMEENYSPPPPEFENPKLQEPIPKGFREPERKYIDTKNEEIIPLGGEKSKKRILKAKEFDSRKNRLTTVKLIRAFSFLAIIIVVALGVKNTFFPSGTWTEEEVGEIAKSSLGETGFPTKRGEAFVESFMKSYLTIDPRKPENQIFLSRFYGETADKASSTIKYSLGYTPEEGVKQSIISGPYVFYQSNITENVAQYKVTTQVTDTNNTTVSTNNNKTVDNSRWVSFDVTVYYDKATNSLIIAEDSPILIPNFQINGKQKVRIPEPSAIGNGEEASEMKSVLTPTIDGFMVAYTKVTSSEHNEIDQYIPADKPVSLMSGFGGTVKVAGNNSQAIQKTIYKTNKADEWIADVSVRLANNVPSSIPKNDKIADENDIIYQSRFLLTIRKAGDNKYEVTKIVPYVYTPKVSEEIQK